MVTVRLCLLVAIILAFLAGWHAYGAEWRACAALLLATFGCVLVAHVVHELARRNRLLDRRLL